MTIRGVTIWRLYSKLSVFENVCNQKGYFYQKRFHNSGPGTKAVGPGKINLNH